MRVVQMNPFSAPSSLPQRRMQEFTTSNSSATKLFDFKSFKTDDWIILGIIATLILEGSDDYVLLCALGYLFIAGI